MKTFVQVCTIVSAVGVIVLSVIYLATQFMVPGLTPTLLSICMASMGYSLFAQHKTNPTKYYKLPMILIAIAVVFNLLAAAGQIISALG